MTDHNRTPQPELVARVLPPGSAIILRDYTLPRRAALAARLQSICCRRGVKLLIGVDLGLAIKISADGVHYPRWCPPHTDAPRHIIVSTSAHNAEELARAKDWHADLALLSPAFASASHDGEAGLGPRAFRMLATQSLVPVLALGGINDTNAHQLTGPNIAGFAAIGAFLR